MTTTTVTYADILFQLIQIFFDTFEFSVEGLEWSDVNKVFEGKKKV